MAPATPPSTGPVMDGVDAGGAEVVVVGGDVESDVTEPAVKGAVVGPVVVGPVVVGGTVGGAVVGETLGLGVGVTLTSDVEKGSMGVLPLPLASIKVMLGRLVVVDWPRQERRKNRRLTMLKRMGYVGTASVDNSCKFVCVLKFPEVHIIA